jgi:hypothetical protein
MNKWLLALIFVLALGYTNVNAETTTTSSVSCVDTNNSPEAGDTTTVCTTTTVTTVTTPESTTTTTSVSENLTTVTNVLTNSTFGDSTSSTDYYYRNTNNNWIIGAKNYANGRGQCSGTTAQPNSTNQYGPCTHSRNINTPSGGNNPTAGGSVATTGDTTIYQDVTSLKDATSMSEAEIQHGWRSTLSANVWFWNDYDNTITLKQTITDNSGNSTTQTRVIADTGCNGSNCGQWEVFDDTYIQGSNSATDYSIRAEFQTIAVNWNTGTQKHRGPDVDDIMLKIQHNEITTSTTTVPESSTSSTATSTATTIEYCWQKVPSTCAGNQPGLDDVEDQVTDAVTNITTNDETIVDVTNLDIQTVEIVDVTIDEAITQELAYSDPETTFEEAFNNIIEGAGLEEEFQDALAEEDITEEEFFEEVEEVMEEEMASTEVAEETTETSNEETTEEVQESDSDVEEQVEGSGETELAETDSEDESVGEVTVEDQVADIQAKIENVIAKVEAKLTRVDLKLKATAFILAKAMVDQQPDMSEYTQLAFYSPTQLEDNKDWYAEATILEVYGRSIYQDTTLATYINNDPVAQYNEQVNTTNNNISRLEAELEELKNELNQ